MPFLVPVAIGLAAAGTATSVVGQVKAGNAAKRAGAAQQDASNSEAALSDWNAQVADLQAKDATARGADEEARFRSSVKGMIGSQRAGIAASNIDVGFGSAVDVQANTAYQGELDALTIKTNAAREAWGYSMSAEDLRQRAAIQRKEGVNQAAAGRQQQAASRWNAAGTIVGGASFLAQQYGFGSTTKATNYIGRDVGAVAKARGR